MMKHKVLAWKSNGKELKDINLDLEQKAPHVYFANRTIEYGESYIDLVIEIDGVYFLEGHYQEGRVLDKGIDFVERFATGYLQKILTDEKLYPCLMKIEIVRRLGMTDSVEMLFTRRDQILAERKSKEEKARLAREEAARIQAASDEERYQSDIQTFLKGETVSNESFARMLRRNDIPVHPRTMCNILNHCSEVGIGILCGVSRRRNYHGVSQAAKILMERLKSKVKSSNI